MRALYAALACPAAGGAHPRTSALHVHVRWVMCASIAAAFTLCLTVQHQPLADVLRCMLTGYAAPDAAAGALLNGGGIVSMLRVTAIVCISAAYSGIFQATGLLGTAKAGIARMSRRITPFGAMFCTAVAASMIACNQTLSILLTHQLCADTEPDGPSCAIDLENSVVVLAPLVPWSIAGAVPLASAGAPEQSLLAACYLYLIPLCSLVWKLLRRRRVAA
ncbi:MAG: Na+/H+ antiporter NhaC family protein [Oscillospiraceae bacterium]